MKLMSLAAAAVALTVALPAAAQDAQSNSQQAEKAKPAKKVCKLIARTGSNMRDRVCLTRDEWERVKEYVEESDGWAG